MNILKFKIPLEVHFRHPVMVDDEYNKHLLTKKVPSKFGITKKIYIFAL